MCFVLYAGIAEPLPIREWNSEQPDVSVTSLKERETPIAQFFSAPHVQYIGSTSRCGCDFPNVMHQGGEWPWWEDAEVEESKHVRVAKENLNRERLAGLLRSSAGSFVELYGVWDGDFALPPLKREEIALADILKPDFRLKERGFYTVRVSS